MDVSPTTPYMESHIAIHPLTSVLPKTTSNNTTHNYLLPHDSWMGVKTSKYSLLKQAVFWG